jgi:hypothetical protein
MLLQRSKMRKKAANYPKTAELPAAVVAASAVFNMMSSTH